MKPTQEQVIAWAREAGLEQTISIAPDNSSRIVSCPPIEPLERLAALAYEAGRKDENEACAKVCDERKLPRLPDSSEFDQLYNQAVSHCAKAIRVRREQ